ncbi:threonylcarbamoyladenosine tRNA methylthiotransferase MtaB [Lachnospiraceae bacterium KHCPX20]|nr:threonylcarbamoyladenosine tRNA methylthiotransferase MtaB [Lachnospiraceae bacterium KHCPX20]
MKTAALHNLGCKTNAYETESMAEMLKADGYTIVPFSDRADVYVINTCSVTAVADQKSRQMISRARRMNRDAVVIAAGCYVQTGKEKLLEDKIADIIIGNNKKNDLIKQLHNFIENRSMIADVEDVNAGQMEFEDLTMHMSDDHSRAFLKIQDGCNQFCSYCIIPYARGRVRCRDKQSILDEVSRLARDGYQEIVLTGIHITSYQTKEGNLVDLVEDMAKIPGITRIRLGSLEPSAVTEEFAKRLSKVDALCPHFHMSLQSGSDTVLQRMNRHYTTEEFKKSCELLKEYFSDPALTTDIICGFPGETEEEFLQTLDFVGAVGFYEIHVFPYSVRQGTRAERMPDQITKKVKQERCQKLRTRAQELKQEYLTRHAGDVREILLEDQQMVEDQLCWMGYTKEYIRCYVPVSEVENHYSGDAVTGYLGQENEDGIYRLQLI